MKEEVYESIRNDLKLRGLLADILGVEVQTVYAYAVRKSKRLELAKCVECIIKNTSFKTVY